MLEKQILKFASNCALSDGMKARSSYIIKLLETVSSGLPKKKHHQQIGDLNQFGVYVLSDHAHLELQALVEQVEEELLLLSSAHLDRYQLSPEQKRQSSPESK